MENIEKKYILNLVIDLPPVLEKFLSQGNFEVLNRSAVRNIEQLDFIIVNDNEEALDISQEYNVEVNNIKIISVENQTKGIRNFLLANGRLSLAEGKNIVDGEEKSYLSHYLYDKFFNENHTLNFSNTLSSKFDTLMKFPVTGHLYTGESLDELSTYAFDSGFNLVSLRSYIDHLIYYFSYLKQANLGQVPFEVEYGMNDELFAINAHLPVRNFVAEYLMDSFGETNSEEPLQYLLGAVYRTTHYLEITYVEKPGRLIITGYFSKDKAKAIKGLSFHNIKTISQIKTEIQRKLDDYQRNPDRAEQLKRTQEALSDKKLPAGFLDMLQGVDAHSVLEKDKDSTDKLVKFLTDSFQEDSPNKEISEFEKLNYDKFSKNYDDPEFIGELTENDEEYIVQRVKKADLYEAFAQQMEGLREQVRNDESAVAGLNDFANSELAQEVATHVDPEKLNELLAAKKKESIFGEFTPTTPEFDTSSAFENLDLNDNTGFSLGGLLGGLDLSDVDQISPEVAQAEKPIVEYGDEDLSELLKEKLSAINDKLEDGIKAKMSGGEDPFEQSFKPSAFEEEGVLKIGGDPGDPNSASVVKGGKEAADDFVQKISELPKEEEDPFVATFKSAMEEKENAGNKVFRSDDPSERKREIEKFIKETLDSPELENVDPAIKAFVHQEAPTEIMKELEAFTKRKGKTLDTLSDEEMKEFQEKIVPKVLKDILEDGERIHGFKEQLGNSEQERELSKFARTLKDSLGRSLGSISSDKKDDIFQVTAKNLKDKKFDDALKSSLKEAFEKCFYINTATLDEIITIENEVAHTLTTSLGIEKSKAIELVQELTNKVKNKELELASEKMEFDPSKDNPLELQQAETFAEQELIAKLKNIEEENKKLKTNVSALQLKLSATDEAKEKFETIMAGAEVEKEEVQVFKADPAEEEEKQKILAEVANSNDLSAEVAEGIQSHLEREAELIELAKKAEAEVKRLELEQKGKEALFKKELEKSEQAVKAKDVVLDKAKSSMKNALQSKEDQINDFKKQVNFLNQKLSEDESVELKYEIKNLSSKNDQLEKSVELHKKNIDKLNNSLAASKANNKEAELAKNLREIQVEKAQLQAQLKTEAKMKSTFEEQFKKAKEAAVEAKTESVNNATELKTVQGQLKLLKDQNATLAKRVAESAAKAPSEKEKEMDKLKSKNKKLQDKYNALMEKFKEASGSATGKSNGIIRASDLAAQEATEAASDKGGPELEKAVKEAKRLKENNQQLLNKVKELEDANSDLKGKNRDQAKAATAAANASANAEPVIDKKLEKEVAGLKNLNKQLQEKFQEAINRLKKAEEDAKNNESNNDPSAKEQRLEQSIKKMNGEISKARSEIAEKKKDAVKMKSEMTALQNQVTKLKKDLEKAEKSSGSKKKAA